MNNVHYSSKTVEWATPEGLFDELDGEFGFNLDPCATDENAKCRDYFTKEDDGLDQSWKNCRVFMNPPYGRVIGKWVEKMATERIKVGVALLPARTDTIWFHKWIYGKAEIRFIKGRIKFGDGKQSSPFPSMIVIFKG